MCRLPFDWTSLMMKITSTLLTPKNRQLASIILPLLCTLLMTIVRAVPHAIIIIRNALLRTIAPTVTRGKDDQGDKDWAQHLLNQSYQKSKAILRVVGLSAIMSKEKKKKNCQNKTFKPVSYLRRFRSWK